MKQKLELDKGLKVFPMILMIVGILIMLAQWIVHLNIVSVVSMAFCCVM